VRDENPAGGPGGGHPAPALPAYLDLPLGEFLAELAAAHAPPAAGCAVAASVALSASLCAMTARLSRRQLTPYVAGELTAEAERLGVRAAALIQADAEAVRQMLSPGQQADAAVVPLQILEVAVRVARLAARLAADCNENLRGDAICAVLVAEAGAKSANALVQLDLPGAPATDPRLVRAAELLRELGA
jgi:formiminotetrahydrofolate cyclodeaminase